MSPGNAHNPLRPQRLTVGQLCTAALSWSVKAAAVVAVVVAAYNPLRALIAGTAIDIGQLAAHTALWLLASFGLLFLLRLLWLSRNLQDRAFTWLGFAATFFGLGMLVVFFVNLGVDAVAWFRVSPRLIDHQNYRYKLKLHEATTALKRKEERTDAESLQGLQGGDPKVAAFYEKHLKAQWEKLLTDAENAAGPAKKAELAKRWQEAKNDAVKRNELISEKVELVQKLLKKNFPDYPRDPKAKNPDEEYPLDGLVYLGLEDMLIELQSVIEVRTEAELGHREAKSPGALFVHFVSSMPGDVAQDSGIYPALLGSIWVALITIIFAVPIGVGAALYLEEYKTSGWLGRIIQININNLAGVPSVVYGILGAFVFVELIFKPIHHSQAQLAYAVAQNPELAVSLWDRFLLWLPTIASRNVLGGGMTLALLTLPVVIVASQEAIRAVPSSIRHGAYALGATHWQTIWHQVLPLARPGILTGTILAISRAIGEAAPLILFGALLFVQQPPTLFSGFTIMPMQIFNWTEYPAEVVPVANHLQLRTQFVTGTVGLLASPTAGPLLAAASSPITSHIPTERIGIWHYNAALASLLLLAVLLVLNGVAIYLRNRAQRNTRW